MRGSNVHRVSRTQRYTGKECTYSKVKIDRGGENPREIWGGGGGGGGGGEAQILLLFHAKKCYNTLNHFEHCLLKEE